MESKIRQMANASSFEMIGIAFQPKQADIWMKSMAKATPQFHPNIRVVWGKEEEPPSVLFNRALRAAKADYTLIAYQDILPLDTISVLRMLMLMRIPGLLMVFPRTLVDSFQAHLYASDPEEWAKIGVGTPLLQSVPWAPSDIFLLNTKALGPEEIWFDEKLPSEKRGASLALFDFCYRLKKRQGVNFVRDARCCFAGPELSDLEYSMQRVRMRKEQLEYLKAKSTEEEIDHYFSEGIKICSKQY